MIFLVVSTSFVYCQNNLVSNYSFEDNNNQTCGRSTSTSDSPKDFWNKINNWSLPDLWTYCVLGERGTPDWFCSGDQGVIARSGDHFIFTGGHKEFIIQKLNKKLVKGREYYYEFYYYATKPEPKEIGIRLEIDKPWQCGKNNSYSNKRFTEAQLQASSDDALNNGWKRASGYFNANDNYEWIVLGVFYDGDQSKSAFYDDIVIREVVDECPEKWLIDNTTFSNNETFQASEYIEIGKGSNPEVLPGMVIINNNATVTLIAKEVVKFNPGIDVRTGSKLDAFNSDCESSPCSSPKFNSEEEIEVCSGNPTTLNLTTDKKETWYISWSPQIHLDDPKSLNPLFTPPSGDGEIEYTLTIKTLCGNSFSKKMNVIYKESPNLNPYHSIQFTPSEFGFTGKFTGQVATGMKEVEYEVVGENFSRTHRVENIGCCNIDFETDPIPNFETCNDYKILFRTKNFCTDNFHETSYDLIPPKSNVLLKDIVQILTLNNDGIAESIAITTKGASRFKITVYNRWGNRKKCKEGGRFNEGSIFEENQIVWTPKDRISSGTYYWVLELFNDCGAATHQYNGFLTVIINNNRSKQKQDDSDESIPQDEQLEIMSLYGPENAIYVGEDDLSKETVIYSSDLELKTNDEKTFSETVLVYPNPAKDNINVEVSTVSKGQIRYELFNYLGKSVYKFVSNEGNRNISIPVSSFKTGVYFLSVKNNSSSINKKIVIK